MIPSWILLDFGAIYDTKAPLLLSMYARGVLRAPWLLLRRRMPLGRETAPGRLVVDMDLCRELILRIRLGVLRERAFRARLRSTYQGISARAEAAAQAVETALKHGRAASRSAVGRMYAATIDLFAFDFYAKHAFPLGAIEETLERLPLKRDCRAVLCDLATPRVLPHYLKFHDELAALAAGGGRRAAEQEFIWSHAFLETYGLAPAPAEDPAFLRARLRKGEAPARYAALHQQALARRENAWAEALAAYRRKWGQTGCANFEGLLGLFSDIADHEETKRYMQARVGRNLRLVAERSGRDPSRCTIEELTARGGAIWVRLEQSCTESSGAKSGRLAELSRAGLPVPRGFVAPLARLDAPRRTLLGWAEALARQMDGACLAVRSSHAAEDGAEESLAGVGRTLLGLRTPDEIARALQLVAAGSAKTGKGGSVLVQELIAPQASGVLMDGLYGKRNCVVVEAVPGLNTAVTSGSGGAVDRFILDQSGRVLSRTLGCKEVVYVCGEKPFGQDDLGSRRASQCGGRKRMFRILAVMEGSGIALGLFAAPVREACLSGRQLRALARLASRVRNLLGWRLDMEWALDHSGALWILQARPATRVVRLRRSAPAGAAGCKVLATGIGVSHGTATGMPRISRNDRTPRPRPGEILVAARVLAADVPALRCFAGIITEEGGLLSHVSIVARELGIPCVVALPDARKILRGASRIMIDGATGVVSRWL